MSSPAPTLAHTPTEKAVLETVQLCPPLAFLLQHAGEHLPPSVVDLLALHTREGFLHCLISATSRETESIYDQYIDKMTDDLNGDV